MAKYTQGLVIDGISYNIPLVEVKVNFDFLEKYAERTEDGVVHMETIGGFQNYTVKVGIIDDIETFQKLYDVVTDPVNRFHKVLIPDTKGNFKFEGYFSGISASISRILDKGVEYKDFTWKMTEKGPTRKG